MRSLLCSAALVMVIANPATAAGDLELTFGGGHVTVIALDVTVQEILQEWARVGDTTFVDSESLTGPPVRLQLIDVPETQALRVLLRDAAGYVAAPRAATADTSSRFDRVLVMPTSRAVPQTNAPVFDGGATGLPPAQQAPGSSFPGWPSDQPQDLPLDELEQLRELLPQPFDLGNERGQSDQPNQSRGAVATAPRPGMTVAPSEEPASFIRRPVRPQPADDDNPR